MPCYRPLPAWVKPGGGVTLQAREGFTDTRLEIPCGQCVGCRIDRARVWAIRICHEAQSHQVSSFITLTYSNEFLPTDGSLNKGDVTKFIKRLRKSIQPQKIKYYLAGEYGEEKGRPHYHAIFFGYWPADCVPYYKSTPDAPLFTSATLERIWKYGQCVIGVCNFQTAQYCSNYITKKITGKMADDYYGNLQPEFAHMSRGGRTGKGISADFYDKYSGEIWNDAKVAIDGRLVSAPKYYRDKVRLENPEVAKKFARMTRDWAIKNRENNSFERLDVRKKVCESKLSTFRKKTF